MAKSENPTGARPDLSQKPPGSQNPKRPANQRGIARLNAVQALYQMDIGGTSLAEIRTQFAARLAGGELEGENWLPGDADFFGQIVSGVLKQQLLIDPMVEEILSDEWPVQRLDATLRAILRAGAFELLFRPDIPARVVVSEYVDVAKAYFGDEVPGMVNAVLDQIAIDQANRRGSGQ